MAKIFVRNRRQIKKGARRPRFTMVAVEGLDLNIFTSNIRRRELEALSEAVGAEVIYLPDKDSDKEKPGKKKG